MSNLKKEINDGKTEWRGNNVEISKLTCLDGVISTVVIFSFELTMKLLISITVSICK